MRYKNLGIPRESREPNTLFALRLLSFLMQATNAKNELKRSFGRKHEYYVFGI